MVELGSKRSSTWMKRGNLLAQGSQVTEVPSRIWDTCNTQGMARITRIETHIRTQQSSATKMQSVVEGYTNQNSLSWSIEIVLGHPASQREIKAQVLPSKSKLKSATPTEMMKLDLKTLSWTSRILRMTTQMFLLRRETLWTKLQFKSSLRMAQLRAILRTDLSSHLLSITLGNLDMVKLINRLIRAWIDHRATRQFQRITSQSQLRTWIRTQVMMRTRAIKVLYILIRLSYSLRMLWGMSNRKSARIRAQSRLSEILVSSSDKLMKVSHLN